MSPKRLSQIGEIYLEEAVLDVLLEAKYKGKCLSATEVRERAGIYHSKGNRDNNAIAFGILHKLVQANRVRCNKEQGKHNRYELTEDEFEERDGYLN